MDVGAGPRALSPLVQPRAEGLDGPRVPAGGRLPRGDLAGGRSPGLRRRGVSRRGRPVAAAGAGVEPRVAARRGDAARARSRARRGAARRPRPGRSRSRRHPRGRLGPSRALHRPGAVGRHRGREGRAVRPRRAREGRHRRGRRRLRHADGDGALGEGRLRRGLPPPPAETRIRPETSTGGCRTGTTHVEPEPARAGDAVGSRDRRADGSSRPRRPTPPSGSASSRTCSACSSRTTPRIYFAAPHVYVAHEPPRPPRGARASTLRRCSGRPTSCRLAPAAP